ncbi:hypothetical protein DSO57_1003772 [Entomophthora muscae]|uniref:Uncharacterized protein n=1 Tax=Entomophthora muscae TaxID=34485 RepID=A0ACC2TKD5_9FUNG|nr:hypothetical protein DSO57_1003772 [Entomophthora muscae]
MSQLPHIFYPSPGDEESYHLGCRRFASSKSAQEKWEKVTRLLEMPNRGREFIGEEFVRLLQDWYWPTEGLAPAEVHLYSGDACLVIRKILEEFVLMQAKYKLLINHSPLLGNDNSSKLVPGYDPGHTLGTGDQEPHKSPTQESFSSSVGGVVEHLDNEMLKGDHIMISKMAPFNGKGSEAKNFLREFKNQSKLML